VCRVCVLLGLRSGSKYFVARTHTGRTHTTHISRSTPLTHNFLQHPPDGIPPRVCVCVRVCVRVCVCVYVCVVSCSPPPPAPEADEGDSRADIKADFNDFNINFNDDDDDDVSVITSPGAGTPDLIRVHETVRGLGEFLLRRDKSARKRRREFSNLARSQQAKIVKVRVCVCTCVCVCVCVCVRHIHPHPPPHTRAC
jgi:hypothetical protein